MANISSNQSWFDSNMANQLRQLFYDQFGRQQDALNFLNARARAMIANPTGYSPAALAAMRAGAIDNLSNEYNHEQQALNAREFAQGGQELPSGVNAQINAGLGAQEAAEKAGAENQITLANEDLKNQNYWRAVDVLNGTAQEQNPISYLNGSLDASAGVGPLANAATNVNNSSFGSQLEGGIARGLGNEITGGNSTGSGTAAGFFGL